MRSTQDLTRRHFLVGATAGAVWGSTVARSVRARDGVDASSLKQASQGLFKIGVGLNDRIADQPADHDLVRAQFQVLTPENCMKPASVQPVEGRFRFERPDSFVAFAQENGLELVGHCLVWAKDDRTPPWFFKDGDQDASRELLLDRMRKHIATEVGRYRGKIASWDVVNEALDDGAGYLRPSGWEKACGIDFIAEAFKAAHEADPDALLIYNDYSNEASAKRDKMIRLVRDLRELDAPIHAVGLQGHYEIDKIPFDDLEATFNALRELGVKVVISEVDLDVIPRGRWWAEDGKYREELAKLNPYREGCPPEVLERQAAQYGELFKLYRKHADVIDRVSFWNLHDGQSWLNGFPWRRVNYPLLFDRQGQPKPAYTAVIEALTAPG